MAQTRNVCVFGAEEVEERKRQQAKPQNGIKFRNSP